MITEDALDDLSHDEPAELYSKQNKNSIILDSSQKPAAVQSVFRAANILTCLSQGIYSITDIAGVCHLNKATVHRLLKALVESNLAIQDPINHLYYLGQSIAKIVASPHTTHEYLVTCAIKSMVRLSDYTEETVFLSILLGLQYLNLHEIPSKHDLRVVQVNKKSGYVPAGAASKILLSQLDKKQLKIAFLNMNFESPLGNISFNPEKLKIQLKEIRRQGYAVSYGERVKGCVCISAPVSNYELPVALSIIGPENRIKPRINDFIEEIMAAAATLSENVNKSLKTI